MRGRPSGRQRRHGTCIAVYCVGLWSWAASVFFSLRSRCMCACAMYVVKCTCRRGTAFVDPGRHTHQPPGPPPRSLRSDRLSQRSKGDRMHPQAGPLAGDGGARSGSPAARIPGASRRVQVSAGGGDGGRGRCVEREEHAVPGCSNHVLSPRAKAPPSQ